MTRNSASAYPLCLKDDDNSNTYPTVEYNLYHNPNHINRVYWDSTVYDSTEQTAWQNAGHIGALFTNPLFINPATGDFTLHPTSLAIDKGTNLGSPYNLGLNPTSTWPNNVSTLDQNSYGSGWEIGAFVYTGIASLPIDQTGWELVYVDSELVENGGYPAENSFDGDPDTFWSTDWDINDIPPHEIQIDMGGFYGICGFRYLPRQDEYENGMINDYEFYVSNNTGDWGTAVASGTFVKDKTEKQVSFDHTLGRYVCLVALSEVNGNPWTTMAELNVLAVQPDSDINDDGKVNLEDFAVIATWWSDDGNCTLPDWCGGADFDMSGTIDFFDLAYFVENWLRQ